jgi:hypothetical protein
MQNNVVVELWGMAEGMCGLIVPCPSGIVYSNQTGGRFCRHPHLEGVYLPVPWAGVAAVARPSSLSSMMCTWTGNRWGNVGTARIGWMRR